VDASPPPSDVTLATVARSWWPLAMSWLLMATEQPIAAIVIARLVAPEINLAAWGGVVFPLALVIEAPIIMMLAASTALSKDRASYMALRRFTHRAGLLLTLLHIALAFTPLYDLLVRGLLDVPEEIVEPARLAFMVLTPWTWAIASRRFNQGALIRFGHSRSVAVGTILRLCVSGLLLLAGWWIEQVPGAVVAGVAISVGVIAEAIYANLRIRPLLRGVLAHDSGEPPLRGRAFFAFYFPLSLTPLLTLLTQPLGSAAISRMPLPLESLAVWPIISGLVFIFQASGMALNEVVVTHLGTPGARRSLVRFTLLIAGVMLALQLALVASPGVQRWLEIVNKLSPELAALGVTAFWLALPIAPLRALVSWYQGVLVHAHQTRAITESVAVFLVVAATVLYIGVVTRVAPGLHVALTAFSLGFACQALWQRRRARASLEALD
jgi:hypothetical protein